MTSETEESVLRTVEERGEIGRRLVDVFVGEEHRELDDERRTLTEFHRVRCPGLLR